jgi:type I restriction enzyme, S subunit
MVITAQSTKLKPGYKQTEVGVIPEDWEAKKLGEVAMLQRGYDLPHKERKHGIVPIISSSGSTDTHNESRAAGPGVVTGRYGTIGEVFFVSEDFWPLNTTLFVKDFKGNNPLFISFLLRTIDYQSYSGKSGVPGVNRNDLHAIGVSFPPLPEQQAIATALSDIDALLTSLDQLIAKKRDIKQATRQQLLTGKTRLPGFGGKWEMTKLGDVVETILGGGTPSRSKSEYWGGNIPWVTVKDFATFDPHSTQESITEVGLQNSSSNLIKKGTIITSTRMALGKAVIYEVDVSINQDLKAILLKKNINTLFVLYWFEHNAKNIENLGSGSTVKGVSLSDLKNVPFLKPSTITEQTAIVTVLSDMDAEIVALEQRREKTRALKQGMMQELLTGKIRLL